MTILAQKQGIVSTVRSINNTLSMMIFCYIILLCHSLMYHFCCSLLSAASTPVFQTGIPVFHAASARSIILELAWFAVISCLAVASILSKAVAGGLATGLTEDLTSTIAEIAIANATAAKHSSVKVCTAASTDPCLAVTCCHRGHRLYGHHRESCHHHGCTNFCFLHHVIILLLFQLCYIFVTKR